MLWVSGPTAATICTHQQLNGVQNVALTSLQQGLHVTSSSPWEHPQQNVDRRAMLLLVLLMLEVLLLVLELLVLLVVQEVGRWLCYWRMVPRATQDAGTLLGKR
jgi:hypothetical protein